MLSKGTKRKYGPEMGRQINLKLKHKKNFLKRTPY